MKKLWIIILALAGVILAGGIFRWQTHRVTAAPTVLVGSLQGGCYLETPTVCKLSVEPFALNIAPGEELLAFQLSSNGQIVYDYTTSTFYRPTGSYIPSSVALDFAAHCGQTYALKLQALDTGDLDFVTVGQTESFKCPAATYHMYMPYVKR